MHIFPRWLRLRFRGNTLPFLLSLQFRHFFHSILQTCITLQVFFFFFYDLRHIIGDDVQNTPIFDSVKKYIVIYILRHHRTNTNVPLFKFKVEWHLGLFPPSEHCALK